MKKPILFLIFNRPDTTKQVFEAIREHKPKQLFIAADGPREKKDGEEKMCKETREIVSNIDWDCEVKTLFRDENLGCKDAVSSAISWFFEHVEEGIILEDDCLPDQSFFRFCSELLDKYRYDEKIFMISGNNFLPKSLRPKGSYYFTRIPHIWGWATWKRAWDKYDGKMSKFIKYKENCEIKNIWKDKKNQKYWMGKFESTYSGCINSWDFRWNYSIWMNNGVCIAPTFNLVTNVGFGNNSTHTAYRGSNISNIELENMIFPIINNNSQIIYRTGDEYEQKTIYLRNAKLRKILTSLGLLKICKRVYLWIIR